MTRTAAAPSTALVIGLSDPGMTPLLKAGLGGLAASLRAIARADGPKGKWPCPVALGRGCAVVEPRRITLDWSADPPKKVLRLLFERSFLLRPPHGIIDLPGTYRDDQPPSLEIAAVLQDGLKRTFLQHGKTTDKRGGPVVLTTTVDDEPASFSVQPYAWYAHQDAWESVVAALEHGSVRMAGWVYPGAAQRHVGFADTSFSFGPGEILAAVFASVGCASLRIARSNGGVLLVPEPADLVRFAEMRSRLTPNRLADAFAVGPGDAALSVHLALRAEPATARNAIRRVHAVALRAMAWDQKQKSRAAVLTVDHVPEAVLDTYDVAVRTLPTRIRVPKAKDEEAESERVFAASSALRAFVTENLVHRRRWFEGFATATTAEKKPRFIHRYRESIGDLGALYFDERKGLIAMIESLGDAESLLVKSVHSALRQRFGAIADECRDAPATMRNRFASERDRWRHAFAGARTPGQIRAALADLWSRAGTVPELRDAWQRVLPLLEPKQWQAARDLALVALASYQGKEADAENAAVRRRSND